MAAAMGFLSYHTNAHSSECSIELHSCPSILHNHDITSASPTQTINSDSKIVYRPDFCASNMGKV